MLRPMIGRCWRGEQESSTRMRILWASGSPNMKYTSGYANQSSKCIPALAGLGHDVALFATHGWEGMPTAMQFGEYLIPVYPRGADRFGNDMVAQYAKEWAADITISFVDLWVLDGKRYSEAAAWCPLFPVDCEPFPQNDAANLREHAVQPLVYSRFAERVCQEAGIGAAYVPHILETDLFTLGDQKVARESLGWPADAFMVSMVAANRSFPSRKSIPECLKAFKLFSGKHSDALLYLHMGKGGPGDVNVPALIEQLGLQGRVAMPDSYSYTMGVPIERLADIYRASSVLLNPAYGEGLCMPILEAEACGTPVITGDWSGQAEVCFDGYLIEKPGRFVEGYGFVPQEYYLPHGGSHFAPGIGSIVEALERAYADEDTQVRREERHNACLFYSAEHVTANYWQPVLAEIGARL